MTQPTHRPAAFAFILVTVGLDMLALGMIIPVLPKLVKSFLGGDTAQAAQMYGLFGTVWALMQFLVSPIVGALSDRFGRRPIVLMSNFGLGFDYVLMALAPSLGWLFAGRIVSGITAASISTSFAYIADVTPPEQRAERYGLISAAFGLGFIVGPALGGLLGHFGPRVPFAVAAGLSLLNGLYGLLVLPESLPRERRAAFSWRKANGFGSLTLLRSHPQLLGLAAATFLEDVAHSVLPSVFVLYGGYRYAWDERLVGLTLAGVGLSTTIVQSGLVKPIVLRLGERRTLFFGWLAGALAFAVYGAADSGWMFWIGVPIMALWGLASAALQSIMSRHVAADAQGQLQGATSSLMGLAGIIGPGLFTAIFAASIAGGAHQLPGAAFYLAALMLLVAAAIAAFVTRTS